MEHAINVTLHCVTTDLVAVLRVDFATFHSSGAAVAAIVRTPWVVVVVVAVAVSKVLGRSTIFLGIEALALQNRITFASDAQLTHARTRTPLSASQYFL